MSRYAVSLDVEEEIKREQSQEEHQEVDVNIKQLEKQLEDPKQESEDHHEHHNHENTEEVHISLDQLERKLEEPKKDFSQPSYEPSYNSNQGGFFSFVKNHKFAVFLILLVIFGYFYFNSNSEIAVNSQTSLQDVAQLNFKNKNKSIDVLDSILTDGLTVAE